MKREKVKGKKRDKSSGLKGKHTNKCWQGTKTTTLAPSMVQKVGDSAAGTDRACFNERSEKNQYDCDEPVIVGRIHAQT